jgi:hypothetical protein
MTAKKKFYLVIADNQNNFQSRLNNFHINNDTRHMEANIHVNGRNHLVNGMRDAVDTDIAHYTQTMSAVHRWRLRRRDHNPDFFDRARSILKDLNIDIGQED